MGKDGGEAAAVAAAMWYSCSLAAAAWPEKRDSRRGDAHVARGTPRKTERNTERPKRLKLNVKWHLAAIRNTQIAIRNRGIVVTQCGSKIRNTQNAQKYAIAQYAAYGVPHTDALHSVVHGRLTVGVKRHSLRVRHTCCTSLPWRRTWTRRRASMAFCPHLGCNLTQIGSCPKESNPQPFASSRLFSTPRTRP